MRRVATTLREKLNVRVEWGITFIEFEEWIGSEKAE